MKGSKVLAVIALIALTGFLWMACSSDSESGTSGGGGGDDESSVSWYRDRDQFVNTVVLDRDVAVVLSPGGTDRIDIRLPNFNAVSNGAITSLGALTVSSLAPGVGAAAITSRTNTLADTTAVVTITAGGTAGQTSVVVRAIPTNGNVYEKVITVYALTAADLATGTGSTVALDGTLPAAYYNTDAIGTGPNTGVWKDLRVRITTPRITAGYYPPIPSTVITVPFDATTMLTGATAPTFNAANIGSTFGPYNVSPFGGGVAIALTDGIPAFTIVEDKVTNLIVTGAMKNEYFEIFDAGSIDATNLSFTAYWTNPRNTTGSGLGYPMSEVVAGTYKGRAVEVIGGITNFRATFPGGALNNITVGTNTLFCETSASTAANPVYKSPFALQGLPADKYKLTFQYGGVQSATTYEFDYFTVKGDSLVVTYPISDADATPPLTTLLTFKQGAYTSNALMFAGLAAMKPDGLSVVVNYLAPDGTTTNTKDVTKFVTGNAGAPTTLAFNVAASTTPYLYVVNQITGNGQTVALTGAPGAEDRFEVLVANP